MSTEPEAKKLCLDKHSLTQETTTASTSNSILSINQEGLKIIEEENKDLVDLGIADKYSNEYNEDLFDNKGNDLTRYMKELAKSFALVIPAKVNSEAEDNDCNLLKYNFGICGVEYKYDRSNGISCEVWVKPQLSNRRYLIGCSHHLNGGMRRVVKAAAESKAVRNLKRFCNYVEPNPDWFQAHKTPDFIKNRTPCDQIPISYKILTKQDTGTISKEKAEYYEDLLRNSLLEELFFFADYDFQEKTNLMNRTIIGNGNIYDLRFRHFGEDDKFLKRHCCIYKIKSAVEIIKEANMLEGKHPKWLVKFRNSEFIQRRCSTQPILKSPPTFNSAENV